MNTEGFCAVVDFFSAEENVDAQKSELLVFVGSVEWD